MDLNHGGVREEYQEIRSVFNNGRDHSGITSVLFDSLEELVWTGNQSGYLTSYFGPELQKYTSFKVHHGEIRHMLVNDHGILSLSSNKLCFSARSGLRIFNLSGSDLSDMQCMFQKDETHLWVAGHQGLMVDVDLRKGVISKTIEVDPGTVVMKQSNRYLCCGDTSGKVRLRDPSSLKSEHVLEAHTGTLSDFDVSGNLLVTCGFCSRMGHLAIDRFLMVYDLRTLRAIPLQVAIDPLILKFVPAFTSRVAVVSQNGQFQLHEPGGLVTQSSMMVYHVNTHGSLCTTFDISATCQTMVFGDAGGNTHLWGDTQEKDILFNMYSRETEFAAPIPHLHPLAIDDYSIPLSTFPLPMPNGPLLSDWPAENMVFGDRPTPPIEPEILRTMVVRHFIGYAPNPGSRKRNQVAYPLRDLSLNSQEEENSVPDSPMNRDDDPGNVIPKHYRRVEIKYSKLGVEDFDFKHYNRTSFAGLETHIPNAYCNAMLQLFYFIEPLRVGMQNHLCHREFCMACELGFLFHMLDMSSGQTCQANNFLRAFRTIPEAAALGLVLNDVDESFGNANFPRLIQSWFRFVLQQMHQDTLEPPNVSDGEKDDIQTTTGKPHQMSLIQRLFGSNVQLLSRCRCGKESKRDSTTLLFNLEYPEMCEEKQQGPVSFESVISSSLSREQSMQAWCDQCSRYQPTVQSREVKNLPDILALNCGMEHAKEVEFWKIQQQLLDPPKPEEKSTSLPSSGRSCRYGNACSRPDCKFRHDRDVASESGRVEVPEEERLNGWVPLSIMISFDSGKMQVTKIDENQKVRCSENEVVYDLLATVGHVQDFKSGGNLVAHIHVGNTYHSRKEGVTCSQWYLFNDFAITPISPNDAVHFSLDWKLPCAVVFTRRDINGRHETAIRQRIDDSVLYQDVSLVRRGSVSRDFTPLGPDELPKEGDLVGLDAEFVTLNQEEAEIRSDGTRSTIKPSQMSVARVTVVRGNGQLTGVPFIDDYISTTEQVVDYLTKFSGIKPGDLDATMSSKHLTTLKTTYRKLRALVARKVKFVGHGLKKDFRVINILVPKEQVFDTVELFHLPRQRFISLRFLAWYFLGLTIQSETHDSTEDAKTALQLYRKYEELSSKGEFRKVLKQLYEDGRKSGWKVEEKDY
ncbi:PAN2-PAN3 deadenylation complex catalytic subunit PAN2-like isoform X1 [Pocillopora damicornis]|uniref:PAN2-PAN3 deadenylation complex catalytic subunit PAN2-like isoform X1 n=1 Tax=Pocillopora damicornis TaxID=46731 RepID=UPI000F554A11|nr:PAN2-PAN3 deadenylation complex catalytic subunit PAN2-like isoform X1 [Pocillopora damicornis]